MVGDCNDRTVSLDGCELVHQIADLHIEIDREATDRFNLIRSTDIDQQDLIRMRQQRVQLCAAQLLSLEGRFLLRGGSRVGDWRLGWRLLANRRGNE